MTHFTLEDARLSRRSFLGGAAATGALAALGLAGCAPQQQGTSEAVPGTVSGSTETATATSFLTAPEPISEADITATKDADVVIVGCGISGMAAARAAAEAGAKVIVVEKSERFNCRGSMGSQLGSIGSTYQVEAGYPDIDTAALINRYMQDTLQMASQPFSSTGPTIPARTWTGSWSSATR